MPAWRPLDERIMEKVEKGDDGCWVWTGTLHRTGYGQIKVGRVMRQAHRAAFTTFYGPIPAGYELHHVCGRKACVNPAHLKLITRREHARLSESAQKRWCKNGHEYTYENTYTRPNGQRDCRACIRARVQRYKRKTGAA
jgi:hypothetical protein